jgi:hypothetical protein
MRSLGRPEVLKSAALAALLSSLACLPKLLLAGPRLQPLWYQAAVLFLGGIVLWAFVFAWHEQYSGRPVFTFKISWGAFGLATAAGVVGALLNAWLLDPAMRTQRPEEYPHTVAQWLAVTLFTLGFTQLFLVFAPMAWLMRLLRRPQVAAFLTVLFCLAVTSAKVRSGPATDSPELLAGLLLSRGIGAILAVYFFLRGGVFLVWWWAIVVQARLLLQLTG